MNKKGFTLIELLVVIVIMGILASGSYALYSNQTANARNSVRASDTLSMKSAIEVELFDMVDYSDLKLGEADEITGLTKLLKNSYGGKVPSDPSGNYYYLLGFHPTEKNMFVAYYDEDTSSIKANGIDVTDLSITSLLIAGDDAITPSATVNVGTPAVAYKSFFLKNDGTIVQS